ncbi:hypothetical protein CO005_01590, partial [Candidatus Roizmanbacteria bacterium CG_4_8_14_3_um_filter_34_9]
MIDADNIVQKSMNLFPEQIKDSFEKSFILNIPKEYRQVKNIVACGMGGSRFPHYIIKELFKKEIKIPYIINDDYNLPGFVDNNTLVILSSYSGTTEEVLESGKEAYQKNAKILGISSGGPLKTFLESINAHSFYFDPIYNPSGQPRVGFGYLIGGIMGILLNIKILDYQKDEIISAISGVDIRNIEKEAEQMANKIFGKYPY